MSKSILINEVGLRDGLQIQPKFVPTNGKLEIALGLIDAGIKSFEAASFVSPKAVPQMSDASDLFKSLPKNDNIYYSALLFNQKGYERAVESGAKAIAIALASTEKMNMANIRMSLPDAINNLGRLIKMAKKDGLDARAYISTALGCPYEGNVPTETVINLADKMFELGADKIAIADTIGSGGPALVEEVVGKAAKKFGAENLIVHFHDTRALGLINAWVALKVGVTEFDTSLGGLGGCPFAPGAAGNLATEDLAFMLNDAGYETGIDIGKIREAVLIAERYTGQKLGGRISQWWISQERKKAASAASAAE
ncbi:MAG: hydroxymethylglutaryl-CoA lyase [Rhodospirillaceae bacterium]|nr:hydroxymethylglutaryl-CoA lyase [Rhodospirillaceae bacterium]|tara:strand:- start:4163 stop:5095 length:933 start_codon:yes stop_codon:yes gene_type:complete